MWSVYLILTRNTWNGSDCCWAFHTPRCCWSFQLQIQDPKKWGTELPQHQELNPTLPKYAFKASNPTGICLAAKMMLSHCNDYMYHNVRPLTASVWFRVDGLGLGKINTADFAVPHRCADAGHHPPLLQVGLSIQVGRLDVTHAAWVWRVQEQQVCWDGLIANYLDKISHSHILPAPLYKILCFPKTRDTKYQQSLQMVFKKDTDFNIDFCHIY